MGPAGQMPALRCGWWQRRLGGRRPWLWAISPEGRVQHPLWGWPLAARLVNADRLAGGAWREARKRSTVCMKALRGEPALRWPK